MLPANARLMSADDHMIEPPPPVGRPRARQVPRRLPAASSRSTVARPGCSRTSSPTSRWARAGRCRASPRRATRRRPGTARFDEIRPGCYDPVERIKDMDIDGVWGQLCFPNYARFAGHRFFLNVKDHDLGLACLRPTTTTCSTSGARPIPIASSAPRSCRCTTSTSRSPSSSGSLRKGAKAHRVLGESDRARACRRCTPTTGIRSGPGSTRPASRCACTSAARRSLITTSADAPATVLVSLNGVNSMMAGVDWLLSGHPRALPRHQGHPVRGRRRAGSPTSSSAADKAFHDKRIKPNAAIGQTAKGGTIPPSQLFREHMYVCLVDEYFALRSLGDIPVDNLLWEGDFPHGDGLWPNNRTLPGEGARRRLRRGRHQDRRDQPAQAAAGMTYDLLDGVRVVEAVDVRVRPFLRGRARRLGRRRHQGRAAPGRRPDAGNPIAGLPKKDVGVAFMWELLNRGKRCIGLDVGTADGRDVLVDLVERPTCSSPTCSPRARARLRIDPDDLHAVNPDLVYARATGHGTDGPEA